MAFEKFSSFRSKRSSFISITKSFSFGFGGDFLKQYELQNKEYAELFYDPAERKIGFKFTDKKIDENAFKLIRQKKTDSMSVVARSFFTEYLKNFELDHYENRYQAEQVHDPDHGTLYVIQLKEKTQ